MVHRILKKKKIVSNQNFGETKPDDSNKNTTLTSCFYDIP